MALHALCCHPSIADDRSGMFACCRDSTPPATVKTDRISVTTKVFLQATLPSLYVVDGAVNCKALNDLALWLYIYRGEGWGSGVVMMGIIAALSNLPGSSSNISYAFSAANYYTGGVDGFAALVGSMWHQTAACLYLHILCFHV